MKKTTKYLSSTIPLTYILVSLISVNAKASWVSQAAGHVANFGKSFVNDVTSVELPKCGGSICEAIGHFGNEATLRAERERTVQAREEARQAESELASSNSQLAQNNATLVALTSDLQSLNTQYTQYKDQLAINLAKIKNQLTSISQVSETLTRDNESIKDLSRELNLQTQELSEAFGLLISKNQNLINSKELSQDANLSLLVLQKLTEAKSEEIQSTMPKSVLVAYKNTLKLTGEKHSELRALVGKNLNQANEIVKNQINSNLNEKFQIVQTQSDSLQQQFAYNQNEINDLLNRASQILPSRN